MGNKDFRKFISIGFCIAKPYLCDICGNCESSFQKSFHSSSSFDFSITMKVFIITSLIVISISIYSDAHRESEVRGSEGRGSGARESGGRGSNPFRPGEKFEGKNT